ncbi:MAG: CHAD domain-containing protein [Ilumatobacteraceae bacterium]
MAFQLRPTKRIAREIRRLARERLDIALELLEGLEHASAEGIEENVHEVRKRCKEARGLARLVRPSIGKEFDVFNALVRDAATELSSIRDAHAVLATFDHLRAMPHEQDEAFDRVRSGQAELARAATEGLRSGDARIDRAHRLLRDARDGVARWKMPKGFAAISGGLTDTYRRGAKSFRRARRHPSDEGIHEWRKSVKQLWYQVRLLEPAAPSVLGPLRNTLDDLSEALGDDHDLAVLIERLDADPARFGGEEAIALVRSRTRQQQDELRDGAFRTGATVFAEKPEAFVARIQRYWNVFLDQGPELPTGGIAELTADLEPEPPPSPNGSSAGIEYERKFLVTTACDLPPGVLFRQGYAAIDGSLSVRVRDAGPNGCTLTVKSGRGAVRHEFEIQIARNAFDDLWDRTAGRRISKTRSLVPIGAHVAEVDVFHEELDGLVLAEVEFENEESLAVFEPPDWFGAEVTDDPRFSNASLAMNRLDPKLLRKPAAALPEP